MTAIERRFRKELKSLGFEHHSVCLVALSGGGDSMALLDLVHRVSETCQIKVWAARVEHGLRSHEEEEAENQLCESACRQRSINFQVLRSSNGKDPGITRGRGVEQAARTFRRDLLESWAGKIGASRILYGHNADDRLETIFMRLLSGSGPEGLAGIPRVTGLICRPLLSFSRQELRVHLRECGILWAEDRSNTTSDFLRNRFRNELIPLVHDIFPGWMASLDVLGERSDEAAESLFRASEAELPLIPAPVTGEAMGWKKSDWKAASEYSRALALWKAFNCLERSGIPDRRFSWRALKAARGALNRGHDWKSPEMVLTHRDGVILAEPTAMRAAEWRVVIRREDVNPVFSAHFGGFLIHVANQEARRVENYSDIAVETSWPLVIEYDGKGPEPVAHSLEEYHDAIGELVYISIKTAEEGNDAW